MIIKKLNKVTYNISILFVLSILTFPLFGQERHFGNTVVNPDRSTTFRFEDSTAKHVKVICDCYLQKESVTIEDEDYRSAKMKKDETGIWTYTTPPLTSEVYTYMFEADGKNHRDPKNPDSIRVRRDKMSVFFVNGVPQTDLYQSDNLHGRVDTLVFESITGGKNRGILVYTPPHYAENNESYPVLYLLHGLNGNEYSWTERGRAVEILDNLISTGKAQPMIMVLPDANPEQLVAQKEDVGLMKNILLYTTWDNLDFEKCFPKIDSFLSDHYRFSESPNSRAVAGLSAGAKQSANLANMYDSTFAAIGLFSPAVTNKQLPNDQYSYYWIGVGSKDIFYHRIEKFHKKMQQMGIHHTMFKSAGGHIWRNWRVYFTEFSQTLFK